MTRGESTQRRSLRPRPFIAVGLALAALLVSGTHDAISRRADLGPGQGPGAPIPAATEPAGLYQVPASPFIHGSHRGSFEPVPGEDARSIAFANGIVLDTRMGEPALPVELHAESYGTDRDGYYLVQFDGPIRASSRAELESAGATVMGYLANYAYLVRLAPAALGAVDALEHVVWSGLYQPAYKVSDEPELAGREGRTEVIFMLFEGESLASVQDAVGARGGRILESSLPASPMSLIRAEIANADLPLYARMAEIAWIEPYRPTQLDNNNAQWVLQNWDAGSGTRKFWNAGVTGAGQVLSSSDSGLRVTHNMFRDASVSIPGFGDYPTHRKIIAYGMCIDGAPEIAFGDEAGLSYHGSHTGGTLVGNDAPFAVDTRDGMAKDAKIYFLDGGGPSGGIFTPVDLYTLYQKPYDGNAGGAARIMSNSWGSPDGGAYNARGVTTDRFMWDHKDFLICFSAGNNGPAGNTVGSPAAAKNVYTAGGTLNGASAGSIYNPTSRGPTDDGRRKPTACSPGSSVQSASGAGDASYQSLSGTSMACPDAAGTMGLARDYLMQGFYPTGAANAAHAFTPSAALLKALAINGGRQVGALSIPDNNIGWGRIDLDYVLFLPGDARNTVLVDNGDGLGTGDFVEYEVNVTSASEPLRISLVWTDYPGTAGAVTALVNDLNLVVTEPGGAVTYLGSVFSGGQSVTGGVADVKNVEEAVWRTSPTTGNWTIRVEGFNVPVGPQPFALVVSGGLGGNSGTVLVDKAYYNGADMVQIRVEDLNASPGFTVQVSSTTEPVAENVTMVTALAVGEGVFEGSIPTTLFGPDAGNGQLTVSDGDEITVTYVDPSPSHTSHATAQVELTVPILNGVNVIQTSSTSATIGWTTSSGASSQVFYGTTPALGQSSALDGGLVVSHLVTLTGLLPNTSYYYEVESVDHHGNVVHDDYGGNQYRFTTREAGDVLLVVGDASFEETDDYRDAFIQSGWTWDEAPPGFGLLPLVGNTSVGLRSYPAVWWQVGWEQYPSFSDAARDSITRYHAGGGRLAVTSHDVAWDFGDPTSPDYSVARETWLNNEMHVDWQEDPTSFAFVVGLAGDPISGAYTTNIAYDSFRAGAAGDEINSVPGSGTANYVWRNTGFGSDDISVRWQSGSAVGHPDSAVWGGQVTRTVTQCYEWSRLNQAVSDDATRAGILSSTLRWLIGRSRPGVTVTAPNGGEVFVSSPVSVSWTESPDGGTSVDSRRIEYSDDGGESWNLVTAAPGSSPYSWNISALPNAATYLVRVVATDDGTPDLTGVDASNANFTINRPGGDTRGPAVVAGSAFTTPNPPSGPGLFSLSATFDDTRTGNSNIAAAEWSSGASPAPAGTGTAMSGTFTSPTVTATASILASSLAPGLNNLWLRGRDAAGAWGTADSIHVVVNDGAATSVDGGAVARVFGLQPSVPNPFNPETSIRFSLPRSAEAALVIYDVTGREVVRLVKGRLEAGAHEVRWTGRDNGGHTVASGVYFARLSSEGQTATQKMVLMK